MKPWCKVYFKNSNDMSEVGSESVQLIVTSPPEFSKLVLKQQTELIDNPFHTFLPFTYFQNVFQECYRILKRNGVFLFNIGPSNKEHYSELFGANRFGCLIPYIWVQNILRATQFKIQEDFIWVKKDFIREKNNVYEHFFMFTKRRYTSYLNLPTIWVKDTIPQFKTDEICVTPFSEKLLQTIINFFSNEGDTVLDPFAGTGTTGKVAVDLNRNCILYEIDAKYKPIMKNKIGGALTVRLIH